MLFVIHAIDKPDVASLRQQHYPAHRVHIDAVETWGVKILISGPLVADDGLTPVGSHLVVEARDRATVEAFFHADPFFQAGIWRQSSVTAFDKKVG